MSGTAFSYTRRFAELVDELAAVPDCPAMLERLTRGHEPDAHGWCTHVSHSHSWEHHPCPVRRLAGLVERAWHR